MDSLNVILSPAKTAVAGAMDGQDRIAEYDVLRRALDRSDLDDATLALSIVETAKLLGHELRAEDVLDMSDGAAVKREILSSLVLPRPQFPMTMAEHDLEPQRALRRAKMRRIMRHVADFSLLNRRTS